MDWFKMISKYYAQGLYTKDQVKIFVVAGKITAAQYETIAGDVYVAPA